MLRVFFGVFLLNWAVSFAQQNTEFVIAFGSCNKQDKENVLWQEVLKNSPDVWIWGGDNIYSDTDNMQKMKRDYKQQWQQKDYARLTRAMPVMGTWDDHDYGINDGGVEFHKKKESQQLFLDFLKVPEDDQRRTQEGVYHSQVFTVGSKHIKIIVLDTRYFRTKLTRVEGNAKRYQPNTYGQGTLLGEQQWNWLEDELKNSGADFNIIMSSIQILSNQHGFETWGNFPHEVDRLKTLVRDSGAKGVVFLSGDRHISEFSITGAEGVSYPLVDFTSSGLTHVYSKYTSEPNPYRLGKVVSQISFGVVRIDVDSKKIIMQMRGEGNTILQEYVQVYP